MMTTGLRAADLSVPLAERGPTPFASAAWERASAGPRDPAEDRVALVLGESPTFLAMLGDLGEGWVVRHGPAERDVLDEAGRLITVRAVTEPVAPGPGSFGIVVDAVSATAAKVVSAVSAALRLREARENTPLPEPGEAAADFLDRYVLARAAVDVSHLVRLTGVTSDLHHAGLRTSLPAQATARWTEEPAPVPRPAALPPATLPIEPATPGITRADLGRYADLLGAREEAPAEIAADLVRRPATRDAYRAEARATFAATSFPA